MKMLKDRAKDEVLFLFSFGMVVVLAAFLAVLLVAQIYVRWKVNQDFIFLGGHALEALTLGMFFLLMTLVYTHRPRKSNN
jgi:uncharacterized BrkB/YihY/UPF0761 family membrane protein